MNNEVISQNLILNGGFNRGVINDSINTGNCLSGHIPFFLLDSNFLNWQPWSYASIHSEVNCNSYAFLENDGIIQGEIIPYLANKMYYLEFDYYCLNLKNKSNLVICLNDSLKNLKQFFPYDIPSLNKPVFFSNLKTEIEISSKLWHREKLLIISNNILRSIHFEVNCHINKNNLKSGVFIDNVSLKPITSEDLSNDFNIQDVKINSINNLKKKHKSILIISTEQNTISNMNALKNIKKDLPIISRKFERFIILQNNDAINGSNSFIINTKVLTGIYRLVK